MNNYIYKAFISYRHKEPDKKMAEKLQKKLETYRIPRTPNSAYRSWKIFRDETELAASNSLSNKIKTALEQSEFLIVLCSIDTVQSKWCMEEINYFKEIHHNTNNNIIPIIVNGEPDEVLPKAICITTTTHKDTNGNIGICEIIMEPLAADIRADNTRLILKKLDREFLRIAAPLLGCDYDDLYRRNQKRKMQKIILGITSVFTAVTLFTIYSVIMLMQINNQKNELQIKNKELKQKTTELNTNLALLKEKTGEIEELDLSIATRESKIKYANGSMVEAIKYLIDAFPESYNNNKSISEAEYTLSEQIQAFHQKTFTHRLTLEHSNPVSKVGYVGEGNNIVTKDSTGTIYFWDAITGKCKKTFTKDNFDGHNLNLEFENKGVIKNSQLNKYAKDVLHMDASYMILGYEKKDTDELSLCGSDFYISTPYQICKLNGKTGNIIWDYKSKHIAKDYGIYYGENFIARIYGNSEKMEILDSKTGTIIKNYDISPEAKKYISSGTFTLLGCTNKHCYASINTNDILKNQLYAFEIISNKIVTPQILNNYNEFKNCLVKDCAIIDGNFYSVLSYSNNLTKEIIQISCYDEQSLKEKWHYEFEVDNKSSYTRIGKLYSFETYNYCDIIFCINGNKILIIESNSGKCIKEYTLNETIIESYYSKNGHIYNITKNGLEIALLPRWRKERDNIFMYKVHEFPTNINLCGYYNHSYAIIKNNSDEIHNANKVYIYSDIKNPDFHELYSDNEAISDVIINEDGSYIVYYSVSNKNIYVYNFLDDTIKKLIHYDNYISYMNFIEHDKICIMTKKYIFIYDLNSMDEIFSYNINNYIFSEECYTSNGIVASIINRNKIIFIKSDGKIYEWKPKINVSETSPNINNRQTISDNKNIKKFNLSKTGKKCAALIEYYGDTGKRLEVYDTTNNTTVILDKNINLNDNNIEVISFAWLNDNTLAICFGNQYIAYFDTKTGKCVKKISLNDINVSPITIFSLEESENIILLGNNAKLYQINIESGIMNKTIDLPGFLTNNIKYISENEYFLIQNDNTCIFGCNDTQQAWVFNSEIFQIRYYIDNYKGYNAANNQIIIHEDNKIGTYPLYTTEQLLNKAKLFIL